MHVLDARYHILPELCNELRLQVRWQDLQRFLHDSTRVSVASEVHSVAFQLRRQRHSLQRVALFQQLLDDEIAKDIFGKFRRIWKDAVVDRSPNRLVAFVQLHLQKAAALLLLRSLDYAWQDFLERKVGDQRLTSAWIVPRGNWGCVFRNHALAFPAAAPTLLATTACAAAPPTAGVGASAWRPRLPRSRSIAMRPEFVAAPVLQRMGSIRRRRT
mmetsp:Transcript_84172/g.234694  ORF Transcript_84172/g.234694 Transcript_84172/m.234694 type:complete len:215 (+) Transcript_84172:818-1462(+)